jgi:acyl carrier protein
MLTTGRGEQMQNLENEIKALIVSCLQLEGVQPADIEPEVPLFVEGLGLDSIDALELGVAIQKRFKIRIDAANSTNKEHFRSVRSLARFVDANRA